MNRSSKFNLPVLLVKKVPYFLHIHTVCFYICLCWCSIGIINNEMLMHKRLSCHGFSICCTRTIRITSHASPEIGTRLNAHSGDTGTDADIGNETQIISDKNKKVRPPPPRNIKNEKAQAIFQLIENRYSTNIKGDEWSKTRRYIYHIVTDVTDYSKNTSSGNVKRKRLIHKTKNSIDEQQINSVLNYLEQEFHKNHNHNSNNNITKSTATATQVQYISVPYIIQNIPRILKKNVSSQIKPTIEFLKQLYFQNDMFYTAIRRNPKLLLTSGVSSSHNDNVDTGDDEDTIITNTFSDDDNKVLGDSLSSNINIISYFQELNLGLTKQSIHQIEAALINQSTSSGLSTEMIQKHIDPIIKYLLYTVGCYGSRTLSSWEEKNIMVTTSSTSRSQQPIIHLDDAEYTKRSKVVGNMIVKNPKILTLNLQSNIIPKVKYLQSIFCTYSLTSSHDDNVSKDGVDNCILNMYKKFPSVLGLSLNNNIKPTLDLIISVIDSTILELLMKENTYDIINHESIGKKVNPKRRSDQQMVLQKILLQHPQLLGLSTSNLQGKIEYFNSIDYMDLRTTHFGLDADDNDNNESSLSLSCLTLAACVMISSPSVYSLSLKDNIIPKVECLANLWKIGSEFSQAYDINTNEIMMSRRYYYSYLGRKIANYPLILTLSLEGNIRPTINFYNRTGYIQLNDDDGGKCNDVYLPARYLGTSLFNRLLPRWNYYIVEESKRINLHTKKDKNDGGKDEENIEKSKKESSIARPPLHLIASATDSQFCKQMGYNENLYTKFKNEAVPRLKFSSQFDTWLKTGRPIDL